MWMPVMDRVGEEIVASNNIQLQGRVDDVPCKLDARHTMVTESETANDSMRSDCPGSSSHRNMDMNKPVEESGGGKLSVEELTLGNYMMVQGSNNNSNLDSPRAGKFEHLYGLARGSSFRAGDRDLDSQPREMDQMLSRIRQQLAGSPSDRQNLKTFMTRRSDQTHEAFSERLRVAGENSIMKAPALISEGVQLKSPVSSSSFSQLLLKRAMKGKGVVGKNQETPPEYVVGKNQETPPEFVSDQDLGSKEKNSPTPHDVLTLKSSPKGNGIVSHGVENHTKSSCGISLREFLRSSYAKREKRHDLCLFRQLVELVDSAHSQGLFLLDLRPSFFTLAPSKKLKYIGTFGKISLDSDVDEDLNRRKQMVHESSSTGGRDLKKRKMDLHGHSPGNQLQATSTGRFFKRKSPVIDLNVVDARNPDSCELQQQNYIQNLSVPSMTRNQSMSTWLEEQWYTSSEEINGEDSGEKSNIYALGVLLFELLCHCESGDMHAAMMGDLRHRILPPTFLSKYPKEAGFCLWLLHPEPVSRPSAREILKSELICEDNLITVTAADEEISELLLHFLSSLEAQKQKKASKLLKDIRTLEDDIKEAERRYCSNVSLVRSHGAMEKRVQSSPINERCTTSNALFVPTTNTERLMSNIRQLEDAYFFMRSQINLSSSAASARDKCSENQNENQDMKTKGKSSDPMEVFFKGLCKFARYSKFETCGTIRSGDLLNSASVVCSLSFDPDEEHIAAAGISKKIKIFDFNAFMNESVGVHYPLVEMVNKSRLSCVCWNNYIKNYLASTDYDGVVQIWDAGTGQGFSQYAEHQKRAWSVDFSPSDPTKFVSGSDDCSVKLWSINEKKSLGTIWSPANVCCVQFSSYSNHLLAFGSADYKVYCYDLRYVKTPWCTLAGHEKAVSYVKFMDSETIVSASTDNSLKLWNINKKNSSGLSSGACSVTYKGHTNQKNFVGLSVMDGYIACGSETNEVYSYYRSLPMAMTSYKFGSVDPISGNEYFDDNGQFVSSVCWRKKSSMLVAANSTGNMKLLKLV